MTVRTPFIAFVCSLLCAVAAGAAFYLFEQSADPTNDQQTINENLRRELAFAANEAEGFRTGSNRSHNYRYQHLMMKDHEIIRWSSNHFVPDVNALTADTLQFVKTSSGDYVVRLSNRNGETSVTFVPLRERFRVSNNYLSPTTNTHIFHVPIVDLRYPEDAGDILIDYQGRPLFKVALYEPASNYGTVSGILLALAFSFFLAALIGYVRVLVLQHRFERGLLVLVIGGALWRLAMIAMEFPGAWVSHPVFDASYFASSAFNPSMGDLALNALYVSVCCAYIFSYFFRFHFVKALSSVRGTSRLLLAVLFLLVALFGFLYPFLFFETIANNSSIELDWTRSLDFDVVRIVSILSIVIGLVSSFLFCHVFLKVASHVIGVNKYVTFVSTLAVAVLLLFIYSLLLERDYTIPLMTGSALFMLIFVSNWDKSLQRISFSSFIYLLTILCFQALQASFVVKKLENERSAESMERFGASYLVGKDVLGEFLLNEVSSKVAADPFIQTRLANPLFGKSTIRQKIKLVHLNSYFDRYETEIHFFGPSGKPLDGLSRGDFSSFIERYQNQASHTGYPGVFEVDHMDSEYSKQYVTITRVLRGNRLAGFVALAMTQKRVVPRNVYPQLLIDNRFARDNRSANFSYAVFQNDSLVSSSDDLNFKTRREVEAVSGDNEIVTVQGENGDVAMILSPPYSFFDLLTNLSMWILIGVCVVGIWLLLKNLENMGSHFRMTYAARIQSYVFIAFLIPLVTVTTTTLTWTSRSAQQQLESEYADKAKALGEKVVPMLIDFQRDSMDDVEFENFVSSAARLASLDASIYTARGELLATSQPLIFDDQILSKRINPVALPVTGTGTPSVVEEKLGKLEYKSTYYALRSPQTASVVGILGIPFFESNLSLEREQITILSNMSIIFAVTLILFTLFSFVAVRWLTFPLQMITRSLSNTSLKRTNRLLEWKSDDEIGMMVHEYNRMVLNLEQNKIDLARSQKENAWREMAQQVAHEIKNPLTPMKLTLQQMERSLLEDQLSKERATRSVDTLLTQLEILNDIATSFSTFAKMPAPNLVRVDLNQLLKQVVILYANHPGGVVEFQPRSAVFIMGDEPLLSRIFSNLVLNALQSSQEVTAVRVYVRLEPLVNTVKVFVEDNGQGIDATLGDKIFMPHFTTKKSGSGLGLAIAKQGIEQCGGSITFRANAPKGTVFEVEFPLA